MRLVLFWAAALGWLMALIVHLLSVCDIDVEGTVPYVWVLHVGIFLVWIPTILLLRKREEFRTLKGRPPIDFFKLISESIPKWVAVIAVAGLIYAFANFIFFFFQSSGTPAVRNGQYYLQNHGQWIRNITEQEYRHYKASTIRGFSGHWIAFYGVAAAILYPFGKGKASYRPEVGSIF